MPIQTLVVLPARYGSKRLPGKPLLRKTGKYLIQHVWERACAANVGRVVIATDDARILRACREFGAEVLLTSRRHATGSSRALEVSRRIRSRFVINVQGDEPEISPKAIRRIVRALRKHPVVTLASPFPSNARLDDPNRVKVVVDRAGNALYFSRSRIPFPRASPSLPLLHAGIYGCHREALQRWQSLPVGSLETAESLEQLRLLEHGIPIHVLLWPEPWPGGIDTPKDYREFARRLERDPHAGRMTCVSEL